MTEDPSKIVEDAAKNETTSGGDCEEETGADPKKAEQEIYDEVDAYITNGDYPLDSSKQEKNSIRKRAKKFQV